VQFIFCLLNELSSLLLGADLSLRR